MNSYDTQAADFLAKHGIIFSAKLTNTKVLSWKDDGKQRNHFVVTFKRGKKCCSFDYFDSIKNFEEGKKEIRPYDALSNCSSELYCADTFEGFCADFGYDEDSRSAEKLFKACKKMSDKLHKFFDSEKMRADLSEIV